MNREQREKHEKGEKTMHTFAVFAHFAVKNLQGTLPFRRRGEGYARRINWSIPFLTLSVV